jgi:hypothetical protein
MNSWHSCEFNPTMAAQIQPYLYYEKDFMLVHPNFFFWFRPQIHKSGAGSPSVPKFPGEILKFRFNFLIFLINFCLFKFLSGELRSSTLVGGTHPRTPRRFGAGHSAICRSVALEVTQSTRHTRFVGRPIIILILNNLSLDRTCPIASAF